MGTSHDHGAPAHLAGARHRRPLVISLLLVVGFLVVQVVTALLADSLALLSDAGHMATDALGLAMALAAIQLAARGSRRDRHTFGLYRLEILAAGANAVLLLGVAVYVLVEAVRRLGDPVEVASVPVLVVGTLGLVVNVVSFALLRAGAEESLNVRGAYLEVLADLVGSIGVIAGAAIIWATGWDWVDPAIAVAIGLFILPRAVRLGREALRILLQEAPRDIDLGTLGEDLASVDGVVEVHDLHVWTLTSRMDVLTAHLVTEEGVDAHGVLDRARDVLSTRHGIDHATLQVEPVSHQGCAELGW